VLLFPEVKSPGCNTVSIPRSSHNRSGTFPVVERTNLATSVDHGRCWREAGIPHTEKVTGVRKTSHPPSKVLSCAWKSKTSRYCCRYFAPIRQGNRVAATDLPTWFLHRLSLRIRRRNLPFRPHKRRTHHVCLQGNRRDVALEFAFTS